MAGIKSTAEIARKWASVTPSRTAQYEEGVANPRKDWATETAKAAGNYATGIQKAISDKRFEKGVARIGSAGMIAKTLAKGPSRWAQGVAVSESDYEAGFAPYRDVISRTVLPARGPKGDPSNINRVAAIAKALHDRKVKGS